MSEEKGILIPYMTGGYSEVLATYINNRPWFVALDITRNLFFLEVNKDGFYPTLSEVNANKLQHIDSIHKKTIQVQSFQRSKKRVIIDIYAINQIIQKANQRVPINAYDTSFLQWINMIGKRVQSDIENPERITKGINFEVVQKKSRTKEVKPLETVTPKQAVKEYDVHVNASNKSIRNITDYVNSKLLPSIKAVKGADKPKRIIIVEY